ncbi:MAG: hypothetical protein ACK5XA_07715 [Tagaea sp.]
MTKPTVILDLETYRDYFLAAFLNIDTGNVRHVELHDGQPFDGDTVRKILRKYRVVTFNGNNFDLPLLNLAMNGAGAGAIKTWANKIINQNARPWTLGLESPRCDHVDLIEVAPGIASLKAYGSRMHCEHLQDLPIPHDASIAPEDRETLRSYCANDLRTTLALFRRLEPQIDLRTKMGGIYGIDLRSKSDAQIAETVIRREVERRRGAPLAKEDPFRLVGARFQYRAPAFVSFDSDNLRAMLHAIELADFVVGSSGAVTMPKELAGAKIKIGSGVYRMGIGGLHSSEESVAHFADADTVLIDRDVASYYPAIILRCGLTPESLAPHFLPVYRGIVEERLAAKKSGDKVKADALKITINGSFGKFGSPYSILYSPSLLIQVTVTGQLCLLMLIEMIEQAGAQVVSANTDGIVIKAPRRHLPNVEAAVRHWEMTTGFDTEATEYRALYSRDVNNYIAVKPDGSVKLKGAYAEGSLSKAPSAPIATGAVVKYLVDGTPIDETIAACQDIRKFVCARNVKGGAVKDGQPLGRVARWYYALGELDCIRYAVNNYTVPRTEGARPLMTLPASVPADLDREWYVLEARSILRDIGAPQ